MGLRAWVAGRACPGSTSMAKSCAGAWEREGKALVVLQGQAPGEALRGQREPRLGAGLGRVEATQPCWSCGYRIWGDEEGNRLCKPLYLRRGLEG